MKSHPELLWSDATVLRILFKSIEKNGYGTHSTFSTVLLTLFVDPSAEIPIRMGSHYRVAEGNYPSTMLLISDINPNLLIGGRTGAFLQFVWIDLTFPNPVREFKNDYSAIFSDLGQTYVENSKYLYVSKMAFFQVDGENDVLFAITNS